MKKENKRFFRTKTLYPNKAKYLIKINNTKILKFIHADFTKKQPFKMEVTSSFLSKHKKCLWDYKQTKMCAYDF